ncbi:MAG: class I SAM-dependent methyltransferase [Candidatus Bathyarchaeia archaeon]
MLILDVGSGTDELDIARGNVCIDLCKHPKNKPKDFICGDAHHLPFKLGVFDKVCFYEVIEHVESPLLCLREIRQVLKEGGILELSTPNIFHWRIILRQMRGLPQVFSDKGHIACWSMAEMENILLNAGFSKIHFKYATLPLVFSPHKTLDKIVKMILPSTLSEKNVIVTAIKS